MDPRLTLADAEGILRAWSRDGEESKWWDLEAVRPYLPLVVNGAIEYAEYSAPVLGEVGLIDTRGVPDGSLGQFMAANVAAILALDRGIGPTKLPLWLLDLRLLSKVGTVKICHFDGEAIYGESDYPELLTRLAQFSQGNFSPEEAESHSVANSQGKDNRHDKISLRIRSRGTDFFSSLRRSSDWVDLEGLTAAINTILHAEQRRVRAYWAGGGNECMVLFLDGQQADVLRWRGWEISEGQTDREND
jgi:hypothetical protein